MRSTFARIELRGADEHRLRARVWGSGPVRVVFLHGIGDHAGIWDPIVSALPPDVSALCVDLRGHGDSDWSHTGDYARSSFARDVERILGELDPLDLVLVGHSLGASLALEYASHHSARVSGLVLLDMGVRVGSQALMRLDEGLVREAATFEDWAGYLEHLRRRYWLAEPAALEAFARGSARASDQGRIVPKLDPAARKMLRMRDTTRDVWAELQRIRCPTLVVRGAGSAVLSREIAREMAEAHLSNGTWVEIARAGHALLLDNPAETRRAVLDFVGPLLSAGADGSGVRARSDAE